MRDRLLTHDQLTECQTIQSRLPSPPRTLAQVIVARHYATPDQLRDLVAREVARRSSGAVPIPQASGLGVAVAASHGGATATATAPSALDREDVLVGRELMARGLLDGDRVRECVQLTRKARERRPDVRLAQIILKKGYVDREALRTVLAATSAPGAPPPRQVLPSSLERAAPSSASAPVDRGFLGGDNGALNGGRAPNGPSTQGRSVAPRSGPQPRVSPGFFAPADPSFASDASRAGPLFGQPAADPRAPGLFGESSGVVRPMFGLGGASGNPDEASAPLAPPAQRPSGRVAVPGRAATGAYPKPPATGAYPMPPATPPPLPRPLVAPGIDKTKGGHKTVELDPDDPGLPALLRGGPPVYRALSPVQSEESEAPTAYSLSVPQASAQPPSGPIAGDPWGEGRIDSAHFNAFESGRAPPPPVRQAPPRQAPPRQAPAAFGSPFDSTGPAGQAAPPPSAPPRRNGPPTGAVRHPGFPSPQQQPPTRDNFGGYAPVDGSEPNATILGEEDLSGGMGNGGHNPFALPQANDLEARGLANGFAAGGNGFGQPFQAQGSGYAPAPANEFGGPIPGSGYGGPSPFGDAAPENGYGGPSPFEAGSGSGGGNGNGFGGGHGNGFPGANGFGGASPFEAAPGSGFGRASPFGGAVAEQPGSQSGPGAFPTGGVRIDGGVDLVADSELSPGKPSGDVLDFAQPLPEGESEEEPEPRDEPAPRGKRQKRATRATERDATSASRTAADGARARPKKSKLPLILVGVFILLMGGGAFAFKIISERRAIAEKRAAFAGAARSDAPNRNAREALKLGTSLPDWVQSEPEIATQITNLTNEVKALDDREAAMKLLADAKALGPDERMKAAEAAIVRDKTYAVAFLERARARLAIGRKEGNRAYAEARQTAPEDLNEALRLDAKLLEAYWELANLAEMTPAGRDRLRRGYLESIRQADPDGWLGALAAGRLRAIERDYRGALELFGKAIERNAAEPLCYLVRARYELLTGDRARALNDAKQANERATAKSAEALVLQAYVRKEASKDLVGAKSDLVQAIEADPSCAGAYGLRALINCEQATAGWEADAEKALAIDDHEIFALLAKAETLGLDKPSVSAGRPVKDAAKRRQARDLLDKVVERDDTFIPSLQVRATLAIKEGAYDEAFRDCDRILQIEPANARAIGKRGIVFMRQGETEKAKIQLDKAIEYDPILDAALVARAELEVLSKPPSYEEGIKDLDRALHLQPDSPNAYYLRGTAKYNSRTRANRFQEAISDLTQAIQTAEKDTTWIPTAMLVRGLAHQQIKEYREAIADFDEAEKLAGPRPTGNSDLQTLQKQRAKAREDLEKQEKEGAKPEEPKPDDKKPDDKKPEDKKPDEAKPDAKPETKP